MSSIASKNLYELLGNDPEQDPERRTPEQPTKAIDKPAPRSGKRNAPAESPAAPAAGGFSRGPKDSRNANDNAFRDRGVGSDRNRARGSGEPDTGYRGGRGGRGRGGRGRGGPRDDRHSKTGIAEHEKQAAHGWGGQDGNAEFADEQAGEAIAKAEEKDVAAAENEASGDAEAAEPEPEDKTKSYTAYLAELAEKKLSLGSQQVRKANEGSKQKFPEGTALTREEQEEFISGSGGKAKRERQRKEKNVVELDGDRMLQQAPRENSFRGRGRGRGEFRGGEGRGRGGRGGAQSGPNLSDASAFPSLGA